MLFTYIWLGARILFLSFFDCQQHFSYGVLAADNYRLISQYFNNTYQLSVYQEKNGKWAREIPGAAHPLWQDELVVRSLEILI
jgi:hypothetical protein